MRHEYKTAINLMQYHYLKSGLQALMQPDSHMSDSGYFIRSLYFDTLDNTGYYNKVNGLYQRFKLRIRLYSFTSSTLNLEIKQKRGDRVLKKAFLITRDEAQTIVNGNWPQHIAQLLLTEGILCEAYHPKVVIDYQREAYTYPFQKIRLTFDEHIAASHQYNGFLCEDLQTQSIQPQGQRVFEIKYEDMLPQHIIDFIETAALQISGFSKYTNSRAFTQY